MIDLVIVDKVCRSFHSTAEQHGDVNIQEAVIDAFKGQILFRLGSNQSLEQ